MSQSMIEKVAIAIGGLWNDRCNPCTEEKIIECEDCLNAAKAAIEAMREHTPLMNLIYNRYQNLTPDEKISCKLVWEAMINVALKE